MTPRITNAPVASLSEEELDLLTEFLLEDAEEEVHTPRRRHEREEPRTKEKNHRRKTKEVLLYAD